jgi:hypothetical protein
LIDDLNTFLSSFQFFAKAQIIQSFYTSQKNYYKVVSSSTIKAPLKQLKSLIQSSLGKPSADKLSNTLPKEIEQHLIDQITNDWLEESKTRDHDLTSGEVIGYESSQVFADLSGYLKSLENYEEKLVRGEIQW